MKEPKTGLEVVYRSSTPTEMKNLVRRTYLVVQGVAFPYEQFDVSLSANVWVSSEWPYGEPVIDEESRRLLGEVALSPLKRPRAIIWMEERIHPPVSGPVDKSHLVRLDACDIALMVASRKTQLNASRLFIEE